ncbi:MAG: hypothetical protein MZV70_41430 [Desulfobacterales bacterium]|nr:hypothetical protein [Desulfobacterales bacterium]
MAKLLNSFGLNLRISEWWRNTSDTSSCSLLDDLTVTGMSISSCLVKTT